MKSIPASALVDVIPSVLGAGGNPLSLNAVFLTEDSSIPIGVAQGYPSLASVEAWFGANAPETALAGVYFSGFTGADSLPGMLYFYQYNASAVSAYLRGGSVSGLSLTTLQGYSGVLTVAIDGQTVTSANINLATATSFSNAAALIQSGLQTQGGVFTGTATTVNGSPTLDVTAISHGTLAIGDVVTGAGIPVGTTIIAVPAGGGVGNYTMSQNATAGASVSVYVTSAATCSYDSLRAAFVITSASTGVNSAVAYASGTLATDLLLTAATGAVQSAGAAAATPASAMNGVVASTQNWATFMTVFEPDGGSGTTNKLAFAEWVSQASPAGAERFAYVAWDPSTAPAAGSAPASFGAEVAAAGYTGVFPVWNPNSADAGYKAAFVCGVAASIDFTETQGRITFAYKNQAALSADVTDAATASNLESNGYNFYGSYATANQQFTFLQPGSTPGAWKWFDAYINQIAMNAAFQLALVEYLSSVKAAPYNSQGYTGLRAALLDPITQFVNFGAIQPGVPLSASQISQINTAAGNTTAAQTIQQAGWYLQILPASAQVRANRTSPPMTFWYTDGGSIQQVQLASIDVQ